MTARRRRGLVVGKFLPPHAGHRAVVEATARAADEIAIVVVDHPGEHPPAEARAAWVRRLHPAATVAVLPDLCEHDGPCPPACSPTWAAAVEAELGPMDVVGSSEAYGDPFAAALGAVHLAVDPARVRIPISASAIRRDLANGWRWLDPVVRAGLVRRVVVLGAESTGSTTLAADLAEALRTPWTHEHGRAVSEERAAAGTFGTWSRRDFLDIAAAQAALEDAAVAAVADAPAWTPPPRRADLAPLGPLVVCDTDVLATFVWSERYLGAGVPEVLTAGLARPPLLYVLTEPDIPFVQDGLRDGEHLRLRMHDRFVEILAGQPTPWIAVHGTRERRLAAVLDALADRARTSPALDHPAARATTAP